MSKKIIIPVLILIVGVALVGCQAEETSQVVESDTSVKVPQGGQQQTVEVVSDAEAVEDNSEDIYAGADTINLVDVTGGNATGEAWIVFKDDTTYHKVIARNMPDLVANDFYEGWLVKKPASGGFFSTGEMFYDDDEGAWVLEYEVAGDKSDYPDVVITIEPDDGDPDPAEHILEGGL
ncbi:anti-sigma factor [Patescibacteria group bacterium]